MNKSDLLQFIEKSADECVALQKLLTSHKALAPENGGDGEWEKYAALEEFLRAHGITNLERFDAPDSRALHGRRPNLIATIPGKKKPVAAGSFGLENNSGASTDSSASSDNSGAIWVIAHMDVVPVGNLADWKTDPWTVVEKDGKLFGRGVEDNQQGLCSAFAAVWAFVANKVQPERTIKLLFAADEEVGSKYGMIWLLQNHPELFNKNDFFVIPDGGDPLGQTIEVAEKNVLWVQFTVSGKQCHGSRPDEGLNACLAANRLSVALYEGLHKKFDARDDLFEPATCTFEPTKRDANVAGVNIIPGSDVFCFDCRVLPRYKNEEILEEIKKIVAKEEEVSGAKVSFELLQNAQSKATDKNAPVVKALASAIKEAHGIEAKTIGIGGGTVAAELRNLGYDCVVWSSLDETAHMPNEYCVISNITRDAKTLALMFGIE
ncbi:MAG: M20 family metallo-hydrolase [Treponema sp.]|nr:M20 family metallo-hydrolase [Treponema sp.]